jgi:hypothetical protein
MQIVIYLVNKTLVYYLVRNAPVSTSLKPPTHMDKHTHKYLLSHHQVRTYNASAYGVVILVICFLFLVTVSMLD